MKELNIQISEDNFTVLKQSNYSLCIAKRTSDYGYNVIWQADADFSQNNTFSWDDDNDYYIFASRTAELYETVSINISAKQISLGESIVLKKEGCFGDVTESDSKDSIGMTNQYMPIHPGLCKQCKNFAGETENAPFFLCPDLCVPGEFSTKPTEKILVWFQQRADSGMIVSWTEKKGVIIDQSEAILFSSSSRETEIDMEEKNSVTLLYEDWEWKIK